MRPTTDEILRALGDDELPGFRIAHRIEEQWEAEGRRSRFLFWTFEPVMGFSTIYTEMHRLKEAGLVTSREVPDTRPGGTTRHIYKRA